MKVQFCAGLASVSSMMIRPATDGTGIPSHVTPASSHRSVPAIVSWIEYWPIVNSLSLSPEASAGSFDAVVVASCSRSGRVSPNSGPYLEPGRRRAAERDLAQRDLARRRETVGERAHRVGPVREIVISALAVPLLRAVPGEQVDPFEAPGTSDVGRQVSR